MSFRQAVCYQDFDGRFFGKEVEPDSELFWGIYALHVFGFLFFVAMLVWIFYFKGR